MGKNENRNLSILRPQNRPRPWQNLRQSRRQKSAPDQRQIRGLVQKQEKPSKGYLDHLYRRKNKKGTMTEIDAKKRKRRVVKQSRGAGSLSWAEVQAKKAQRPEIRKAQKEAAIEKAKAKKKEQAARKKAAGAAVKKPQQKVNMGNK